MLAYRIFYETSEEEYLKLTEQSSRDAPVLNTSRLLTEHCNQKLYTAIDKAGYDIYQTKAKPSKW